MQCYLASVTYFRQQLTKSINIFFFNSSLC